jgi:glutamate synthase domain-containing protein 3
LSPRDTRIKQRQRIEPRKEKSDSPLDDTILLDVKDAIREKSSVVKNYKINNTNRSVGTKLAGELAYLYGDKGLPDGTIELRFNGSAGQSFGAFLVNGIRMILVGEANDYVGKGMCGGEIMIMPPFGRATAAQDVIIGNTVLYGATGGTLYASGRAGERFCVRNSGAMAVVEGVGDHGCEYMTGGRVVVLGATGRNFAAGMSGGVAYVLDEIGDFGEFRCNREMVDVEELIDAEEIELVRGLIAKHVQYTDSGVGRRVLERWAECQRKFVKIMPVDYRRVLREAAERDVHQGDRPAAGELVEVSHG